MLIIIKNIKQTASNFFEKFANIICFFKGEISGIARAGSGSACRSTYGGFVRWYMGSDPKGTDSIAKPIVPHTHWPEMRILILVVNDSKKKVSSAIGMKRTLMTSDLMKCRVEKILPKRVNEMEQAIKNKNFESFAELTMRDSNQMHAACLDAYPPCIYMNDTSHLIVEMIHFYNSASNRTKVGIITKICSLKIVTNKKIDLIKNFNLLQAAYTFDAGPNATIYLLEKDVAEFMSVLNYYFPAADDSQIEYQKGIPVDIKVPSQVEFYSYKNYFIKLLFIIA